MLDLECGKPKIKEASSGITMNALSGGVPLLYTIVVTTSMKKLSTYCRTPQIIPLHVGLGKNPSSASFFRTCGFFCVAEKGDGQEKFGNLFDMPIHAFAFSQTFRTTSLQFVCRLARVFHHG
jgi:hypothetical protein